MNIEHAMGLAAQAHPNMYIRGAASNEAGWTFAFDFTQDGPFPSQPGLPQVGVDREPEELFNLLPGNDAFWRFLTDSNPVPLPQPR